MTEEKKNTKQISRRNLLQTGLGTVSGMMLGAFGGALGLKIQQNRDLSKKNLSSHRVLKIFLTWEKHFPGAGSGAISLQKRVHTLSAGQLTIDYIDSKELTTSEMVKKFMAGEADGIYSLPDVWAKKIPANLLFSAQPFGPNAEELQQWLSSGGGYEIWRNIHKPIDIIPFAVGASLGQMGGWFSDEIFSVGDLDKVSIAARGLPALLYRRAGAKVYQYDDKNVFSALQSGKIEGVIFGDPVYDEAFGLNKVATHYFSPAFHAPVQIYQLSLRTIRWAGLSDTDQEIIRTAAMAELQSLIAINGEANRLAIRRLVREQKVVLREFPASMVTSMARFWQVVVAEESKKNADFAKIYRSMHDFVSQNQSWQQLSRNPYEVLRHNLFFADGAPLKY